MIILSGKFPIYIIILQVFRNCKKKVSRRQKPQEKTAAISSRQLQITSYSFGSFGNFHTAAIFFLHKPPAPGGIKQADRNGSCLCLLASAVNMHGIGFLIDDKIADRQGLSSWFRAIRFYYVQYFLLSYNYIINSIFVNANPQQDFS